MNSHSCNLDDSFFSLSNSEGSSSNDSFHSIPSLSEALDSHLPGLLKTFNAIHINAQSIPAHYPDMLSSFDNKNIHAVLVSESWLKSCLPSLSYSLPGFHLIRNDRVGRTGGGVAIYLRSHIPFTILNFSQPSSSAEHLFIEIVFGHEKLLLGVYYSPNLTVDYFCSFETLLEQFSPLYNHTIIMGDFNTCLLKNDNRSSRLKSIVSGSNLHLLPLLATHAVPNCAPSLLDLILVSSIDHVEKHGQCDASAFSYHDLLFLSYKLKPPKAKPRILLQRNFGRMDLERLREDAAKIDWSVVSKADTVDDMLHIFNSLLTQLYDLHAPIRPVRMKHLPAPWLTADIKKLQEKKNIAKSKYRLNSSDSNREKYLKARNRCNMVCRDSQRRHIYKSVVEEEDSSKVWYFLKSLGVGKAKQNVDSCNLDLNQLNQHFSSSATIDSKAKLNTINQLSAVSTPDIPPFFFSQFTISDVEKNITAITSDAVGSDCISRKMIIPILDLLAPIITYIFNHSINTNDFPSSWKDAQIIPLPKKSNPTYAEYRPISILPFLSKALERLVHQQLSKFLSKHNLLNPLQSGFRPGHSTTTALVRITDDIRLGMDNQLVTVLTLLDFSNAFNTVDFDILLAVLGSLNISPDVIGWFHCYLHGRRQRVRVNDSSSDWSLVRAGVPQGGVLSPLLFSIFINSICSHITSLYHLYADDLQIYLQCKMVDLANTIDLVNEDLLRILKWSCSFGLKVNPKKTQVIVIGSPKIISKVNMSQLPPILFDGVHIPYSNNVKNLGIIFDQSFSWIPQISELSRKMFRAVGSLRRLRNVLPIPTKIALAQSLLLPILDYADACYLDLTEDQLNKLERLQNICIRFIFGLRKYDHISEFRRKLKWLPIRFRRNTHILHLLYCILFNPSSPCYLKERFEYLCNTHSFSLRSQNNLRLKIPSHSSSYYTKSFTVTAILLWNSLPLDIKYSKSLSIFKSKLKLFYLSSI